MSREDQIRDDNQSEEAPDTSPPLDDVPVAEAEMAASDEETTEELSLEIQIERANARAEEYLDSLQRERASFQNYKRRVERERAEQRQQVSGDLLSKLLPVLDDFHRALDAVPEGERNSWYEGIILIQHKLERVLENEGVTEIDALGQPFDPYFHEAVGVDDCADAESGTITQVMLRGYMHGDRVLRPAMVRVAG